MSVVSLSVAASDAQPRIRTSRWRRVVREPLLHFALLGTAIFIVAHAAEQSKRDAQVSIVVDDGLRQRLANLYRTQFGVAPTQSQAHALLDDYINDEMLYREALRLGLDQDDEIIRRRLIQKLDFLQRDSVAQSEPTQSELRAYYDANRSQFTTGARVSFTHLYFNPDRDSDAQALARAREARRELSLHGESVDSDAFPLESSYNEATRGDARRVFGDSAFVDALFTARNSEWSEPVRSGLGWHLFRITAIEAPRLASFEEVQPDVEAALLQAAMTRARRQQLDTLRTRYHVKSTSVAQ